MPRKAVFGRGGPRFASNIETSMPWAPVVPVPIALADVHASDFPSHTELVESGTFWLSRRTAVCLLLDSTDVGKHEVT